MVPIILPFEGSAVFTNDLCIHTHTLFFLRREKEKGREGGGEEGEREIERENKREKLFCSMKMLQNEFKIFTFRLQVIFAHSIKNIIFLYI